MRRVLLAALALLLLPGLAHAQATIDGGTVNSNESSASSTLTIPAFTTDTDPPGVLVVCVAVQGADTTYSVSSISWNAHSLSQAVSRQVSGGVTKAELWYYVGAEASTSADVTVTFSENVTAALAHGYIIDGAAASAPEATGTNDVANATSITASATTVSADALAVDCLAHLASAASPAPATTEAGQTDIGGYQVQHSSGNLYQGGSSAPGPGTPGARTMGWNSLDGSSASASDVIAVFANAPSASATVKSLVGPGIIEGQR